jgi:putative restriction endonuclease
VSRIETRQNRIARGSAFPLRIRAEYEKRCCVSGILIATPAYLYEVEAAHVVPVSEGGTDDIRNGLALTQTLHWAFDRGLFGIRPDRTIYLPGRVKAMTENSYLGQFEGRQILEAKTTQLRAHPDALEWHFKNRVKQWD